MKRRFMFSCTMDSAAQQSPLKLEIAVLNPVFLNKPYTDDTIGMSVWEIRIRRVNLLSSGTDSFSRSQAAVIPKLLMCATV